MTSRRGASLLTGRLKGVGKALSVAGLTAALMAGASPTARGAFPGTNGKIAFFSNEDSGEIDIWRMNPNGTDRDQITDDTGITDNDPAYSPNGQMIAFSKNNEIYVANANGTGANSTGVQGEDISWINNNKLLYSNNETDIYTVEVDGDNNDAVKTTPMSESEPDWSKAMQRIVFVRYDGTDNEIFTMKLDGSGVRRLTNNGQYRWEDDPDWAPDGSRIAFQRWELGGTGDIYTMKPNGRGVKRLTDHGADDEEPAYSPDKRFIAFETTRRGFDDEIWKMRSDGSQETKVTDNDVSDDNPDWQPLH